jgi:hypothetical protein
VDTPYFFSAKDCHQLTIQIKDLASPGSEQAIDARDILLVINGNKTAG